MPQALNRRGKLAAWIGAAGAALTIIAWDWRPLALGVLIMLALAATGRTATPPQPPEE